MQAIHTRVEKIFECYSVDRAGSRLLGVAVITEGDALGHGQYVDAETLQQVVELANAKPQGRLPVNYSHGWASWSGSDSLGDRLGYAENFRLDGSVVRADIRFTASNLIADKVDQVLTMAETAPTTFGVSIVFDGWSELINNVAYTRIYSLYTADIVGVPAANPNGLFAATSNHRKPVTMQTPDTPDTGAQAQTPEPQLSLSAFERVAQIVKGMLSGTAAQAEATPEVDPQPVATEQPQQEAKAEAEAEAETEDKPEHDAETAPESAETAAPAAAPEPEEVAALLSAMNPQAAASILSKFDASTQQAIRAFMQPTNPANPPQPQGGSVMPGPRNMNTGYSGAEIAKFAARFALAKSNQSGERLVRKGAKSFSVNFVDTVARARQWFPDWFTETVYTDPLLQFLREIPIDGAPTADIIQKQLIAVDYASSQLWARGAGDCGFNPTGQHNIGQRTLTIRPMHVHDEICPNLFKDQLNGEFWVGDDIIPREAVMMEAMFGQLRKELVRQMLYGDYNAGGNDNAIDGFTTLFTAGASLPATDFGHIPAGQFLNQAAWTTGNALDNLQALLGAVPANLHGRPLFIALPPAYVEYFYHDYFTTYSSAIATFNPADRDRVPYAVTLMDVRFVPMQALSSTNGGTDSVFLFTPENMAFGLRQYELGDTTPYAMWFNEEEQKVRWRVQANAGVQYVFGRELVIGRI